MKGEIDAMRIKEMIPIEKRHYHKCYFCGAVKSVKYIVTIDDPDHPGHTKEVDCCNRCTLTAPNAQIRASPCHMFDKAMLYLIENYKSLLILQVTNKEADIDVSEDSKYRS